MMMQMHHMGEELNPVEFVVAVVPEKLVRIREEYDIRYE